MLIYIAPYAELQRRWATYLTYLLTFVPTAFHSLMQPDLLRLAQDLNVAPPAKAY